MRELEARDGSKFSVGHTVAFDDACGLNAGRVVQIADGRNGPRVLIALAQHRREWLSACDVFRRVIYKRLR